MSWKKFILVLLKFVNLIIFSSAVSAHIADPPNSDRTGESILIPRDLAQKTGLMISTQNFVRFRFKIDESGHISECSPHSKKTQLETVNAGCHLIQSRLKWPPRLKKSGRVKPGTVRVRLWWPEKTKAEFESIFGGALPISMGKWIKKIEFGELGKYKMFSGNFVTNLRINNDGRAETCSITGKPLPQKLSDTICKQFIDHSYWVPAEDIQSNTIPTDVSLVSELDIYGGKCHKFTSFSFDNSAGTFKWTISTGDHLCEFDARDFR